MNTFCWDGRTLATDAQEVTILVDGQPITLVTGTVAAFGPLSAGALGALSCGATASRALQAGQEVATALTPPPSADTEEPPQLHEAQS